VPKVATYNGRTNIHSFYVPFLHTLTKFLERLMTETNKPNNKSTVIQFNVGNGQPAPKPAKTKKTKKSNKNNLTVSKKTGDIRPPIKEPTETCNAWAKDHHCKKPSGWGTDHVGAGRCRTHGGSGGRRKEGEFPASKLLHHKILEQFEEVTNRAPEQLSSVDNEINVLRSGFYEYCQECISKNKLFSADVLTKYTSGLVKLIELKNKIEGKIDQSKIPTQIIIYYVNKLNTILKNRIQDNELLNMIAADMRRIELVEPRNSNGQRT